MLERAQAKVEGMHFEIRKNLLKFDDVMNDQRKVIYEQRREIMEAQSVEDLVRDMRHEVIEDTIRATIPHGSYAEQWDTDALHTECQRLLGLDLPIDEWAKEEGIADAELLERITEESDKKIAAKVADTGSDLWRRMENPSSCNCSTSNGKSTCSSSTTCVRALICALSVKKTR